MAEARHVVVGTAGHVDHGKTSLVRALTGVDTDRLPEEKKRGITIELGFASWPLGAGVTASVVDVPGHERFVRTMVAGAAGIDVVVLVVAADDGVMPQTREHLAVCELLGVSAGVIAITKADLADDEVIELVRDDVRQTVQGTFLEEAPIVACSSRDGRGLDELRRAVLAAASSAPSRPAGGPLFLPIDRVFTRPGFGTVVTGTLVRGQIEVGQAVDVLPDERGGVIEGLRVRGLHVHDQAVERVRAASRVAVNLKGDGAQAVTRGAAVASAGWQRPTDVLFAQVKLLAGARPIDRRELLSLHVGTREVHVTATAIEGHAPEPGGEGFLRLSCDAPVAAFAGQRLVLRRPDRRGQSTIGGGSVVDPHPSRAKGALGRQASQLFSLEKDAKGRARALIASSRERGVSLVEARRRMPPDDDARAALSRLEADKAVVSVSQGAAQGPSQSASAPASSSQAGEGARYVLREHLERAERLLVEGLGRFHQERPLVLGVAPKELGALLPTTSAHLAAVALGRLEASGEVLQQDGLVRLATHRPGAAFQGSPIEALLACVEAGGLTPPTEDEARSSLSLTPQVFRDALSELRRRGLVKVLGGLPFSTTALDDLKGRVKEHFKTKAELSTADFKALAGGVSRKFAIPLLEWLDGEGLTLRKGDGRVAGRAAR